MNKYAIYHKSKSNYSFPISADTLKLRLRTASGDFDKAVAVCGVKYAWHNKKEYLMEKVLSDEEFDYYETTVTEETKRFTYYFKLLVEDKKQDNDKKEKKNREEKVFFYTEDGLTDINNEGILKEYFFQFPYINNIDRHQIPKWTENAACYQIFPDRFYNGNPELSPKNVKPWGTKPNPWNYMGGDLPGITKKLDYIKELGINVIYMTPFFKSNSNHKYDTIDYFEIDPHFGTKEDFKALVNKAHALGIRVMLDAVFNHSAVEFFAFQDVLKNEENSKYKDWFYINKFPINPQRLFTTAAKSKKDNWYMVNGENILTYECFGYFPGMPKLNTENKELKQYLLDVAEYWIREFDIDGWRLDVSNEVDHSFWRDFRKTVKNAKKETLIIGEIWDNGEPWLRGEQFDGIMNYGLTNAIKDFIAYNTIGKKSFIRRVNQLLMRNTDTANAAMLNLLDSHDTERILSSLKDNKDKLLTCLGIIYTFPGIPMIYYGTEIGMTGSNDPGCRKCMPWKETKWNKTILKNVKKLIEIYKSEKALKKGNFKWFNAGNNNITSYTRNYKNETVIILINNNDRCENISLPEEFSNTKELFSNSKSTTGLKANSIKILKKT